MRTQEYKKYQNVDWRNKKIKITWSDGTIEYFPIKSLHHYIRIRHLVDMENQKVRESK